MDDAQNVSRSPKKKTDKKRKKQHDDSQPSSNTDSSLASTPPAKRKFYNEEEGETMEAEASVLVSNSTSTSEDISTAEGERRTLTPAVSETTASENSVDDFKIRQAVCVLCNKLIPDLFDVFDSNMDDSAVPMAAAHKCRSCTNPTAIHAQQSGAVERQTSVEEVVVISDEESEVITLTSSSSDDEIVVSSPVIDITKPKKTKGAKRRNSNNKKEFKTEKLNTQDKIHPKYNLYKENIKKSIAKDSENSALDAPNTNLRKPSVEETSPSSISTYVSGTTSEELDSSIDQPNKSVAHPVFAPSKLAKGEKQVDLSTAQSISAPGNAADNEKQVDLSVAQLIYVPSKSVDDEKHNEQKESVNGETLPGEPACNNTNTAEADDITSIDSNKQQIGTLGESLGKNTEDWLPESAEVPETEIKEYSKAAKLEENIAYKEVDAKGLANVECEDVVTKDANMDQMPDPNAPHPEHLNKAEGVVTKGDKMLHQVSESKQLRAEELAKTDGIPSDDLDQTSQSRELHFKEHDKFVETKDTDMQQRRESEDFDSIEVDFKPLSEDDENKGDAVENDQIKVDIKLSPENNLNISDEKKQDISYIQPMDEDITIQDKVDETRIEVELKDNMSITEGSGQSLGCEIGKDDNERTSSGNLGSSSKDNQQTELNVSKGAEKQDSHATEIQTNVEETVNEQLGIDNLPVPETISERRETEESEAIIDKGISDLEKKSAERVTIESHSSIDQKCEQIVENVPRHSHSGSNTNVSEVDQLMKTDDTVEVIVSGDTKEFSVPSDIMSGSIEKTITEVHQVGMKDVSKHPKQNQQDKKKNKQRYSSKVQGISSFLCDFHIQTTETTTKMVDDAENEPCSIEEEPVETVEQQSECAANVDEAVATETTDDTHNLVYESAICWDWLEDQGTPEVIAICRQEYRSSYENYLRGCSWSPDGSILVTNSDDNILRIFKTPLEDAEDGDRGAGNELKPCLRLSEGETVYDTCWYPYMTSQDPDTCCLLTTSRDHPVHLWDTNTGRIRCSYRAFDQMDELASAHSVSFNANGSKIYCGFNNCIRIFDSARPGRDFVEKSIVPKKTRSRKERQQATLNQRGIVSCISFSNQYSGLYALGTFSKTVGLYSANQDEPLFLLKEHQGGITQLRFTSDGFYLVSGARKDGELIAWDMRNTSYPLFKMNRNVSTNQCIQFDIDLSCKYLCSGNTNNDVSIWNIHDIMLSVGDDVISHDPLLSFQAHNDAVNGVSLHPTSKLLATASGQRHFILNDADSDHDDAAIETGNQSRLVYDNSLKIWRL